MALVSKRFSKNTRLQDCAVKDPSHVTPGSKGDFVGLIQTALMLIDNLPIADAEIAAHSYGDTTTKAVLAYKRKRHIINPAYQKSEDNIVGKMTIAALDKDMRAREIAALVPEDPRRWSISTAR